MRDPRLVSGVALAEFRLPALLFTLSPADSPSTHYFVQAAPLNPVPFCSRLDSDSCFGPLVPARLYAKGVSPALTTGPEASRPETVKSHLKNEAVEAKRHCRTYPGHTAC